MCPDVAPLRSVSHLYGKEDLQTEEREDNTKEGRNGGTIGWREQRITGRKKERGQKEGRKNKKEGRKMMTGIKGGMKEKTIGRKKGRKRTIGRKDGGREEREDDRKEEHKRGKGEE